MKKTTTPNRAAEEREDDHAPVWLEGEFDGIDGEDAQVEGKERGAQDQGEHRHGAGRPGAGDARERGSRREARHAGPRAPTTLTATHGLTAGRAAHDRDHGHSHGTDSARQPRATTATQPQRAEPQRPQPR